MKFTPSLAYKGDPVNNRMSLIITSCVGIPLCSLFSFLGLFFYYEKDACCIAFLSNPKVFSNMKTDYKRNIHLKERKDDNI